MFTGIIEDMGTIAAIEKSGTNISFDIRSSISATLQPDESLSHNGICLTIESVTKEEHRVTAIAETLEKTNAGGWQTGHLINLERPLHLNDRLDGHLVQGHVDTTVVCKHIQEREGSHVFTFSFPGKFAEFIIEKGSVCINGVSLTAYNISENRFTVAIIPYTYTHTNFKNLRQGDVANIEFDMLGKYAIRYLQLKQ